MKNLGLAAKTAIPGIIIAVGVTVALAMLIFQQQKDLAVGQARKTAKSISRQVMADRAVYTSEVVQKIKGEGLQVGFSQNYKSEPGKIPLPATFIHKTSEVVNAGDQSEGHTVDLKSLWNINAQKAPKGDFEKEALLEVAEDRDAIPQRVKGDRYYAVTADVANVQACVTCHNNLEEKIGRDKRFKLNDVMGGVVISLPMTEEFETARANATKLTIGLFAAFAILLVLQWLIVNRPLVNSLSELERAAERISMGQLDEPIRMDRNDEVGGLAKAFERMRSSLAAAMQSYGDDDDDDL